jgi:hypothetical protein
MSRLLNMSPRATRRLYTRALRPRTHVGLWRIGRANKRHVREWLGQHKSRRRVWSRVWLLQLRPCTAAPARSSRPIVPSRDSPVSPYRSWHSAQRIPVCPTAQRGPPGIGDSRTPRPLGQRKAHRWLYLPSAPAPGVHRVAAAAAPPCALRGQSRRAHRRDKPVAVRAK